MGSTSQMIRYVYDTANIGAKASLAPIYTYPINNLTKNAVLLPPPKVTANKLAWLRQAYYIKEIAWFKAKSLMILHQ